jgi:hypothetical protein
MAGELIGTYDPKEVSLIVSGLTASGFFDGIFIKITRNDKEIYKTHVGAHGEVGRTKNNDISGKITFTLKSTSPFNKQMDLLKLSPAAFPVLTKNNSSAKHIAAASSAWVHTEPDKEYGDEESGIEWEIECADLIMSHI